MDESDFINIHENIIKPAEKQIISDVLRHECYSNSGIEYKLLLKEK